MIIIQWTRLYIGLSSLCIVSSIILVWIKALSMIGDKIVVLVRDITIMLLQSKFINKLLYYNHLTGSLRRALIYSATVEWQPLRFTEMSKPKSIRTLHLYHGCEEILWTKDYSALVPLWLSPDALSCDSSTQWRLSNRFRRVNEQWKSPDRRLFFFPCHFETLYGYHANLNKLQKRTDGDFSDGMH